MSDLYSPDSVFLRLCAAVLSITCAAKCASAAELPNIVLINADDIGYGDFGCYGATAVKTPNIDRLASEGLRFTDAHAAASTCTPSRFAMLTGEYPWRQKGTGILPGDASLIIPPGRVTLASMLHDAGYTTGIVGKWHLGLGAGKPDWNGDLKPGPLEVGFDSCFIIPATGDRTPCVYVKDHRVVGLDPADPIEISYQKKVGNEPTGAERPDLLTLKPSHGHDNTIVNGISRIGYMSGGKAARWHDETIADTLTKQAVGFIESHHDKPFFLYFATHDIHVPRVPHPRFRGATPMGSRGDAIVEFDWSAGEVLKTLDKFGLADNTLVLLTSDNGPVVDDGYQDEAVEKLGAHKPAGPLRGGKGTAWEGGTREPFIVRWPKHVPGGKTSDALVCQMDLLASLAALTHQTLPNHAGPDSVNVLPALLGELAKGRDQLVEAGHGIAIRRGNWKLLEAGRIGANRKPADVPKQDQLYDLESDLAETKDLTSEHPEKVRELSQLLKDIRAAGRMPSEH
ncbi:MAG TPA: arylsulfatase [Lacipirellulaceae bacterium]|nr:arylsulfatase [Lacipirellulaceae bacterium]